MLSIVWYRRGNWVVKAMTFGCTRIFTPAAAPRQVNQTNRYASSSSDQDNEAWSAKRQITPRPAIETMASMIAPQSQRAAEAAMVSARASMRASRFTLRSFACCWRKLYLALAATISLYKAWPSGILSSN